MIIAVDFDGTIARTAFPVIKGEIRGAIKAVRSFQSAGHTVILWTCREGEKLDEALHWLRKHNFVPDYVNCYPDEVLAKWGTDPRKVAADVYIDDRNAMTRINWKKIRKFVNRKAEREKHNEN